jgi:hypothetical protein
MPITVKPHYFKLNGQRNKMPMGHIAHLSNLGLLLYNYFGSVVLEKKIFK